MSTVKDPAPKPVAKGESVRDAVRRSSARDLEGAIAEAFRRALERK